MGRAGFDHAFLDSFLRDRDAAEEALVAFVKEDHEDDLVDIEDQIFDLFRHLRSPRALEFYIARLGEQIEGAEDETIEAFAELGDVAVGPLLDLYNELEEEEAGEVAFVLAAIQAPDPRITELLLGRLEYDAQDAAICLGLHGDPAAKPALERLLAEVKERPEAVTLRAEVEAAIEEVSKEREREERAPFNIYETCEEFQPPYFEVMEPAEAFQWIESPDPRVRRALADNIDDADLSESLVLELANRAATDEDLSVRCALWRAVMLGELSEALLDTVRSRMEDDSVEDLERVTLLIMLAKAAYSPEVKSRILDFYGNQELRATAIEAMWYSADPEFLPLVRAHLLDDDIEIRRSAILGAGFYVDTSSAPQLIPSMSVEDLRLDAIHSYALAHPGKVTRITAQQVLKHVEQVAGGLEGGEITVAMTGIDLRLGLQGIRPYFAESHQDDHH